LRQLNGLTGGVDRRIILLEDDVSSAADLIAGSIYYHSRVSPR